MLKPFEFIAVAEVILDFSTVFVVTAIGTAVF